MDYVNMISRSDFRSKKTCRSLIMTYWEQRRPLSADYYLRFTTGSRKSDNNGSAHNYSDFLMAKRSFLRQTKQIELKFYPLDIMMYK